MLSDIDEKNAEHLLSEESSIPGDINFSAQEQRQKFLGGLAPEKTSESDKVTTENKATTDVREYFRLTSFKKTAETIDSDPNHPWNTVINGDFLIQDDSGAILAGETYDDDEPQGSKAGLLIAEKTADRQNNSIFIKNLSGDQRRAILEEIHSIVPSLPENLRYEYVHKLIQGVLNLSEHPLNQERLATIVLELLPDISKNESSQESLDWGNMQTRPSIEQQKQLTKFLSLVKRKMPTEKYRDRVQRFQDELRFTEDPFGRNYGHIFSQARQWVLEDRTDTQRDYDLLKRAEPQEYSIKDKITRTFSSPDDLEKVLGSIPVEKMPDLLSKTRGPEVAEMVDLEQVVGGNNMKTWSVSTSEGRGLPRIYELTKQYSEGTEFIAGKNDPIRVVKVGGKYYIETDGRHRTAALKALGVKEVPMLVTHISDK